MFIPFLWSVINERLLSLTKVNHGLIAARWCTGAPQVRVPALPPTGHAWDRPGPAPAAAPQPRTARHPPELLYQGCGGKAKRDAFSLQIPPRARCHGHAASIELEETMTCRECWLLKIPQMQQELFRVLFTEPRHDFTTLMFLIKSKLSVTKSKKVRD